MISPIVPLIQFLKTNFCSDYLYMIERHTFCFSIYVQSKHILFASIINSTLFVQVLS